MTEDTEVKSIDLALQGGGSHGAFTWGVLERLLEDERVKLEGLCGTSAGAMNAVMVAHGLQLDGREGAIELLNKFWRAISSSQTFSPLQPSILDEIKGEGGLEYSPAYIMMEAFSTLVSPYQLPLTKLNPLRDILLNLVDFDRLQNCEKTKLFVCATNVRTSRPKVFTAQDISVDAVLASSCLPQLFRAVEIDGEYYWDGGFMGNPPIFPLIRNTSTSDILIVQINPINIRDVPETPSEIRDRVNELSFNSSLMHEMRRIFLMQKILDSGVKLPGEHREFRDVYLHNINPEKQIAHYTTSSKLNASWSHLQRLKKIGKNAASEWLNENYENLGHASTCDVSEIFL